MPDSSRFAPALLAALLMLPPLAAPAPVLAQPAEGEVIDRVVAVVRIRLGAGGRYGDPVGRQATGPSAGDTETLPADVITRSGLEFEARVAMISRGATAAATDALDDDALRSALENAIWERLLAGEADVLEAFPVEPAELSAAQRSFKSRFEDEDAYAAFLRRNDVDAQALEAVLRRSLRANKVLDSKVRLRAQVSETDVRRYYEANAARLGQPFEQVRGILREKLFRERYQGLVQKELEQLERTHDVRRISPLAQQRGRAAE